MSCHTVCGMVAPMKTFIKENCVGFKKTNEKFGGFSNMCSGYVINNGEVEFPTSEHLYQVCKFGEYPDIQRELISEKNPMIMKNKTKKYKNYVRRDWDKIKVDVMEWVLKGKLVCNFIKFGNLLLESGDKLIVEVSGKDEFWGMKEDGNSFIGSNLLGEKLVELRKMIWTNDGELKEWEVDGGLGLKIYGNWMERVSVDKNVYDIGLRSFGFLMKKYKTGMFAPIQKADQCRLLIKSEEVDELNLLAA